METEYSFNGKLISYAISTVGYRIYLGDKLWIRQSEPNIPYPATTYEESCIKHIEELCKTSSPTVTTGSGITGSYVILESSTNKTITEEISAYLPLNTIFREHKTTDWFSFAESGYYLELAPGNYLITGKVQFLDITNNTSIKFLAHGSETANPELINTYDIIFQTLNSCGYFMSNTGVYTLPITTSVLRINSDYKYIRFSILLNNGTATLDGKSTRIQIVRLGD